MAVRIHFLNWLPSQIMRSLSSCYNWPRSFRGITTFCPLHAGHGATSCFKQHNQADRRVNLVTLFYEETKLKVRGVVFFVVFNWSSLLDSVMIADGHSINKFNKSSHLTNKIQRNCIWVITPVVTTKPTHINLESLINQQVLQIHHCSSTQKSSEQKCQLTCVHVLRSEWHSWHWPLHGCLHWGQRMGPPGQRLAASPLSASPLGSRRSSLGEFAKQKWGVGAGGI